MFQFFAKTKARPTQELVDQYKKYCERVTELLHQAGKKMFDLI